LTDLVSDTVQQLKDGEGLGKGLGDLVQTAKGGLENLLGDEQENDSQSLGELGDLSTFSREADKSSEQPEIEHKSIAVNKNETKDDNLIIENSDKGKVSPSSLPSVTNKPAERPVQNKSDTKSVSVEKPITSISEEDFLDKKIPLTEQKILTDALTPSITLQGEQHVTHPKKQDVKQKIDDHVEVADRETETYTNSWSDNCQDTEGDVQADVSLKEEAAGIATAVKPELDESECKASEELIAKELQNPVVKEIINANGGNENNLEGEDALDSTEHLLDKESELLVSQGNKMEKEIEAFIERLRLKDATILKLTKEMVSMRERSSGLSKKLKKRDLLVRKLKSQCRATKTLESSLEQKIKKLEKADTEYEALLAEARELSEKVIEHEQNTLELKKVVFKAEEEKVELQEVVESMKKKAQQIGGQLEDKNQLLERNRLLHAGNVELQNQLSESSEQMLSLEQGRKELLTELKELSDMITMRDEEINRLRSVSDLAEDTKIEMQNKEVREEELKKEIQNLEKKLEMETGDLRESDNAWREKLNLLTKAKHDLEKRLGDSSEVISEATRPLLLQIQALDKTEKGRIYALEAAERSLRERLVESVKDLEAERLKNDKSKSQREDLMIQEAKSSVQIKQLRQECERLKRTLNQREQELSELSQEREKLALDFSHGKGTMKELSSEFATTEKGLLEQVTNLQSLLDTERSRSQSLDEERVELKRQLVVSQQNTKIGNAYSDIASDLWLSRLSKPSFYGEDNAPGQGNEVQTAVVDQLRQELELRSEEIENYKQKLDCLRETKQTLTDKIVELQSENHATAKHKNIELRYKIATELISEKDAEIRSLKEEIMKMNADSKENLD